MTFRMTVLSHKPPILNPVGRPVGPAMDSLTVEVDCPPAAVFAAMAYAAEQVGWDDIVSVTITRG